VTGAQTVAMDIRQATARVSFGLPRPVDDGGVGFVWKRVAEDGGSYTLGASGTAGYSSRRRRCPLSGHSTS
jgi:hypothetical protein